MKEIELRDVDESNIDDLIYVCSSKRLNDPIHRKGVEIKKKWLQKMLREYGPIAKIAYHKDRPVAQILYYPEKANPSSPRKREEVILLHCIYNPTSDAQRKGIATMLMQSLIDEAKDGISCLNGRPCRYIITHAFAFDTKELLPLPEFYRKMGFRPVPEGRQEDMYLEVGAKYESVEKFFQEPWLPSECLHGQYMPLSEDKGKALIFYSPVCQFSYPFAVRASELVKEVSQNLPIEFINHWDKPEEYIKRGRSWLIVNARAIKTWPFNKEEFQKEIKEALSRNS